MPTDENGSPPDAGQSPGSPRSPWFGSNGSGLGYHPQTWQGWAILLAVVAVIVTLVVLLRTGTL
jgi:hypothetical protein